MKVRDAIFLLARDEEGEEEFTWFGMHGVIQMVPLWKWLLAPPGNGGLQSGDTAPGSTCDR